MKTLLLIRHSKTEQIHDGNKTDFERKLLLRGFEDSKNIAEQIKKMDQIPDYIISSDAVRALQTAKEFAKVFDYPENKIEHHRFLYDGYTTAEFLYLFTKFDTQYDTIAVIGHNPDIAMMANNLGSKNNYHYPTSAVTAIAFDVDNWKDINAREGITKWFITPKDFK